MSELNINPSLLRTVANNLNRTLQNFAVVIGNMSRIEQDIPSAWKSGYTDMYLEKFSEVKRKVQTTKNDLASIQTGLYATARKVEDLERSLIQTLDQNKDSQ